MNKLPIGIQTFKNLINEGYRYVDKTPFGAEYALQGRSMELGLEAYDKMLDQRTLKIPGRKKGAF
jgi:hypothetical protein